MRFVIFLIILFLAGCGGGGGGSHDQQEQSTPFYILPQTGQTACYEIPLNGSTTPCAGSGQDGETRAGVSWPVPRFTSSTTGVVLDHLTGLEWTAQRNAPGPAACSPAALKTWDEALAFIDCINQNIYLGHSDWHLPNVVELSSMLNADLDLSFSEQFEVGTWGYWWTSTSSMSNSTYAFESLAEDGYLGTEEKTNLLKVWPVRKSASGAVTLHKTGQATCYDSLGASIECLGTGQDGDLLSGLSWPDPRFTDNGDETITDNLTNLVWTKNTNYPYSEVCSPDTTDFASSVNYIQCLNDHKYLGYDDWRLPNEIEIRSVNNFSLPSDQKSAWLAGYGFYNFSSAWVQSWSSTIEDTSGPVGIWVGGGHWVDDYQFGHVWPVRSAREP